MISPLRAVLLETYYQASRPRRWWHRRLAARAGRVPMAVLTYHRVADDRATPWTTSRRMFSRHVDWLRRRFDLVSLAELQRRLREGNRTPAVALTFDDGYADNCAHAIPLLVRERIPCTYFVTTGNVLEGRPFAHDLRRGYPFPPNTVDELRWMADAGIEIGGHAYTHADLGRGRDLRMLRREIIDAKRDLESAVGCSLRYFAFPFGQYFQLSSAAVAVCAEAGYEGICSAYGGYNRPSDDPFHIQRVVIDDDMPRLKNRASIDPRALRTPRFTPGRASTSAPSPPESTLGAATAGMGTLPQPLDLAAS